MESNITTQQNIVPTNETPSFDLSYVKNSVTIEELMEEMDTFIKDMNNANFNSSFDIQKGMMLGYCAMMQIFQDIIERMEELSPDPENDPLITKLYQCYESIENLKGKCDYI